MKPSHLIAILLLALTLLPASAQPPPALPGLAVHHYSDPLFWSYGGLTVFPGLTVQRAADSFQWPPAQERTGWSLAIYGALTLDEPGAYLFKQSGSRAELFLAGRHIPLGGQTVVDLPAGSSALRLFLKNDPRQPASSIRLNLLWKTPGAADFQPVPPAALSHTGPDEDRLQVYRAWIPLTNPRTPIHNRRVFTVTLPREGFWEILGPYAPNDRMYKLWCDGRPLCTRQGDSPSRIGLWGDERSLAYLPAGKHEITLYTTGGNPWTWEDKIDQALAGAPFGMLQLGPDSPEAGLLVTAQREDLVLKRGEPLALRLEQMTDTARKYRVEVRRQREEGPLLWSVPASLPANPAHAVADVAYPCDQEGAFEYLVRDESGERVDGPWAFVVVDATPLILSKAGGTEVPPLQKAVLVDSVDCTLAEDPAHQFRDNGTSVVVETPAGKYRLTGEHPLTQRSYIKENGVWRVTNPGEKGTWTFPVMDWFAYTLHVKHPGVPHLLVATVPNDARRFMPLQVLDQVSGQYQAAALDLGDAPAAGAFTTVRLPLWPNGDLDVHTFNANSFRGAAVDRRAGFQKFELYEYPEGFGSLPAAASGWDTDKQFGFCGEQLNIGMEQRMTPKLWAEDDVLPPVFPRSLDWNDGYHDWKAMYQVWDRWGQYADWFGQNLLIWPVYTYGYQSVINMPALPQYYEAYMAGERYRSRFVDPYERDLFKLMLLTAQKHRVKLVADFMVQRLEPVHLMTLDPSWQGKPDGMLLTNLQGKLCVGFGSNILNPAHPAARGYLLELVRELGKQYGKYPAFGGLYTRQWAPSVPLDIDGWFAGMESGYDDFTVGLFEDEAGVTVPVTDATDARFKLRHDWLLANARDKWVRWRCDKVYSLRQEMLAELRKYAPEARLYSSDGPDRHGAAATGWRQKTMRETGEDLAAGIDPEQVAGQPELGWVGCESYGGDTFEFGLLDPTNWQNFDLRLPADQRPTIAQKLDGYCVYPHGLCTGYGGSLRPYPYVLQGAAESLARGQGLDTMLWSGCWVLPPLEEGLRVFVQAWRALPKLDYQLVPGGADDPVVAWQGKRGGETVSYLINRTDQARTVTVKVAGGGGVKDLVTGQALATGAEARITLPPYMLSVLSTRGTITIQQQP